MIRNLIDEIVRRRLWPILLAAVVVAVGAPLLFLKSGSAVPPVSTSAPAPAKPGELPARAQRLLTANEAPQGAARTPGSSARDPFQAPRSHRPKAAGEATGEGAIKPTTPVGREAQPVPVVVTNSDGSKPRTSPAAPVTVTTPAPAQDAPVRTVAKRVTAIDVRYGESHPGGVYRSIPRHQTFVAGGRVIAVFVKYSPKRDKAVFAIAPRTLVTGGIECRRKEGVCRYVDIPAGRHVRLTTLSASGNVVSRRLDVMRIDRSRSPGGSVRSTPADGSCLLGKLLALTAKDSPLAANACKN